MPLLRVVASSSANDFHRFIQRILFTIDERAKLVRSRKIREINGRNLSLPTRSFRKIGLASQPASQPEGFEMYADDNAISLLHLLSRRFQWTLRQWTVSTTVPRVAQTPGDSPHHDETNVSLLDCAFHALFHGLPVEIIMSLDPFLSLPFSSHPHLRTYLRSTCKFCPPSNRLCCSSTPCQQISG